MHYGHAAQDIYFSDNPQAMNYPDIFDAFLPVRRHISIMEFAFDREAVRRAMKALNVSQTDLAKAVGLTSQSAVSSILNGTRNVKVEEARRIYSHLQLVPGAVEPIRSVPIIGLSSAGAWREAVSVPIGTMSIPAAIGSKEAFAIEVKGDSMDLLIDDGGYVLVDPAQKQLYDGKVYLIENGEYETTVKRYRSNPARFCPMSTNPDHKEFELGNGHYRVIGRVIWKGGMVE
jgi:phage repressor protein C with HTH and peptisase S24 domain